MTRQNQAEGWSVRQTEHAVTEILAAEDGEAPAPKPRGKRECGANRNSSNCHP